MAQAKIYEYSKCSSCRKAIQYLDRRKVNYETVDITLQPPSKEELEYMLSQYKGDIRKLFNTSGVHYREMNIKNRIREMSPEEAIALLTTNGRLVKRPFLITKKAGKVGFNEDEWRSLF